MASSDIKLPLTELLREACVLTLMLYLMSAKGASLFLSAAPHSMWDPGSWARDRIRTPCLVARSLNPWTTTEGPKGASPTHRGAVLDYPHPQSRRVG